MIPRATYRIQFHAGFRFDQAAALSGYLADLGISHLYASPIAKARKGSTHGYDVVDPTAINPELGGEDGFRAMAAALRARGIGIILDIVPNHMAVGGADNTWWMDVLEKGSASAFARYFDINWAASDPALHGKLLAPFLGVPYGEALTSGALALADDSSAIVVHDTHRFPIRAEDRIGAALECGTTAGLHALLERQHYRLAWWRTAADEINWRRFFDITELAGLRVEDPVVFDTLHELPFRLFREGLIDGVRVDHVDGLADPASYLRRLSSALCDGRSKPGYLVVEKILASDERLPKCWGTDGTSGYDFMNEVSALLHDPTGEPALTGYWSRQTGRSASFHDEEQLARAETLERTFPAQLSAVVAAFHQIARADIQCRDISEGMIRRALRGLLLNFDAYRTYAGTSQDGCERLQRAAALARHTAASGEAEMIDLLVNWILDAKRGPLFADAARRFEQLSAPLAAKAIEDTAFYRYGRLLSRNDVGFDPARFSQDAATFVGRVTGRAKDFPFAMLTTATHDHKRGEDVRARLAVLSEIPKQWESFVAHMEERDLGRSVDPGDRLMILQTIVGAFPYDPDEVHALSDRVAAWSRKSVREAKLRSSWTAPDEVYEEHCATYVRALLAHDGPRNSIQTFVAGIEAAGAINGLTQTLLKYVLPGVPDCYQGCDYWDLSLVDPDNRRPVDYLARRDVAKWDDRLNLAAHWRDGHIKQALISGLAALRRAVPDVFSAPAELLEVRGDRKDNIIAVRRRSGTATLFALAPLQCASGIGDENNLSISSEWLGATEISLSDGKDEDAAQWVRVAPLLRSSPVAFFVDHP
ncbi:malto-oligosyltrehalose synthase [Sphingomonas sp. AP4-R1]|uniref:malto-oligosyltrehalose synthase n=1 Tax=Sphingomonas sp. AP4-R1 TaxID=2735134 RepID=UPI0014933147|nr:malto-oligosyltrehalose synthase [Sphingomonas sp. AP4-R1]QJU59189.1 malto-oligosyltrehalose synthase [Sphingomonas sp. AP4-R1]